MSVPARLPSIRDLVYRAHGDEIRAAAHYAARDVSTSDAYIAEWNNALTAKVNSLSTEEHQRYQDLIKVEVDRREATPSKDDILACVQKYIFFLT